MLLMHPCCFGKFRAGPAGEISLSRKPGPDDGRCRTASRPNGLEREDTPPVGMRIPFLGLDVIFGDQSFGNVGLTFG